MLYKPELHNFDKFISDWDINSEYVLFGASKECVQFIRSLDKLFGDTKLKIKCIVDHDVKQTSVADNINQISSFYRQPKTIDNKRSNIKLVHIDEFKPEDNEKVIITTDAYRMEYKKYLEAKNIKHTLYKNIVSIWPFKYLNKVHIFQTDIMVTQRCNLNCTHCNMFIPHYDSPGHQELDNIIKDIDLYFSIVDYVSILHLVGGEPFLHPNIENIVRHILVRYSDKVDKLTITTNGTVIPKESMLNLLKEHDVVLSVSNYTDKLVKLQSKVTKTIEIYKELGIKHFVRSNIEWYDFGDLRIKKGMGTDELINHFDNCTAPFRGLHNGKFYYCHLNTSAVLTKLFPLHKNDYVELENVSQESLIKFDLGFTELGYITFCDNCNGCNTGINIPVSYEKQGVRQ